MIWKPLPWYFIPHSNIPLIEISDKGDIKTFRFKEPFVMRDYVNGNWYRYFQFTLNKKRHTLTTHKAVALTFLGELPQGYEINHKDWDKENNKLSNLEYITRSENMKHAYKTGLKTPLSWETHHFYGKTWKDFHLSTPVAQYTPDNKLVKIHNSMADIKRELWYNQSHISKSIKQNKQAYWFIWKKC